MLCGLMVAIVTALSILQAPALSIVEGPALSIVEGPALSVVEGPVSSETLTLEVRVFNGAEEVTGRTRLTVHRAGDRRESIPHSRSGDGRVQLAVPAGIYDVQAIEERDGRVVNIQWANRLVVMPYPDERGHHLEVINFKNGYGALQVRIAGSGLPDVALFETSKRDRPVGIPFTGPSYMLFIVPAASYDLRVRSGDRLTWHNGIEVPLDRTRLVVIEQ